jgi:hypothetical protein
MPSKWRNTDATVLELERMLRIQALRADGLKPHHVGRVFVGLGMLERYRISECCAEVVFDGWVYTFEHDERVGYFRDDIGWGANK